MYLQHVGEDVIDDEGITQPIIHGDAQNHFEHHSIKTQVRVSTSYFSVGTINFTTPPFIP